MCYNFVSANRGYSQNPMTFWTGKETNLLQSSLRDRAQLNVFVIFKSCLIKRIICVFYCDTSLIGNLH